MAEEGSHERGDALRRTHRERRREGRRQKGRKEQRDTRKGDRPTQTQPHRLNLASGMTKLFCGSSDRHHLLMERNVFTTSRRKHQGATKPFCVTSRDRVEAILHVCRLSQHCKSHGRNP